jgi:hypothetical protein
MFKVTRRTVNVWAALVTGMTVVAAVLSYLEPQPIAPGSQQSISSTTPGASYNGPLFNTLPQVKPGRWSAVVIRFSGEQAGSLTTINQTQASQGKVDAGFHFVINNGHGKPDGEIEMGFRWQRQLVGDFAQGEKAEWFNTHAIGVCVVGNPDDKPLTNNQVRELTWLVRQLQERLNIPAQNVVVQAADNGTGRFFPYSEFRMQLTQSRTTDQASNQWLASNTQDAPAARPAASR